MKSAAQAGTLGGKAADASPVADMAKDLGAGRARFHQALADEGTERQRRREMDTKVLQYLASKQEAANAAKEKSKLAEDSLAYRREKDEADRRSREKIASSALSVRERLANKRATGGEDKPLSPVYIERFGGGRDAFKQLDALETTLNSDKGLRGPLLGRIGGANPWATESQAVQAELDTAKQIIGKFMEGGVLRKEDEHKYEKILPRLSDTPEVAQEKLKIVREMLRRRQEDNVAALRAQGYDTRGIELPDVSGVADQGGASGGWGEALAAPGEKPLEDMTDEELEAYIQSGGVP